MSYLSRHLQRLDRPPRDWQCVDCGYRCTSPTCEADLTGDHIACGASENGGHHRDGSDEQGAERIVGYINPSGSGEGNWMFHAECGYLFSVHDRTNLANALPFGCPTETTAREGWGR